MRTAMHGMPRIGANRSLKRALEGFWAGRVTAEQLQETAASIRRRNWEAAAAAGIDFIPSNDFSLYDHVLDAAVMVGATSPTVRPRQAGARARALLRHGPGRDGRRCYGRPPRPDQVVRHQLPPPGA